MANRNVKCQTSIDFSCGLSAFKIPKSTIITINCCLYGHVSVDSRDISVIGGDKNGYAVVMLKSQPGIQWDTHEPYEAVVAKWKAAIA